MEPYLPLLQHPSAKLILQMAYRLSGMQRSSQNIAIAADRAAKVVFALKSYARYDRSEERVRANIVDGIDTVLMLYHNQMKHGVEITRNYEAIPQILCYPDELNQVWTNLIHNSLQAMQYRGNLEVAAFLENGMVVIAISDSGCGIPEAIRDRIFEPFFTTKPAGEGSGLGLDIVKKILQKHKGDIRVESRPGRTSFYIRLPNE